MAKITITISDVQDKNVIKWLERLQPLKNNITIKELENTGELKNFWMKYKEYLPEINHSKDSALIAINIAHFTAILQKYGIALPPHKMLTNFFKNNIGMGCLGAKSVRSKMTKRAIHCWVFENPFRGETCE